MEQQIKPGVKQTFGIFAPILGLKQDFPVILLQKTFMPDNQKAHIKYGEIHRSKLATDTLLNGESVKVQTPDTNPILHYHRFIRESDAKEYLLVFTKAHIYYWNESTKAYVTKFTCASDCTEWHTVTFNDKIIATNNVDKVLNWYPAIGGGLFLPLGSTDGIDFGRSYTNETIVDETSAAGQKVLKVASTTGYTADDKVVIARGEVREEEAVVFSVQAGVSLTFDDNLTYQHTAGILTTVDAESASDQKVLNVTSTVGFEEGEIITINEGGSHESQRQISSIQAGVSLTMTTNLFYTHAIAEEVWGHNGQDDKVEEYESDYLTKAKYVEVFENYLFLGYTEENGVSCPQNVRWSDLLDETDWYTGDSGGAEIGSRDFITGLIKYKGFLIVFKQESVHQMWLTEASTDIFNNKPLFTELGCKASDSIIMDDKENLYFFASDNTFRHLLYGEISQPIDPIVKAIKPSLVDGIKSTFIDEYGEIWWAIPHGTCSANNKIIKYKKVWNQEDTAVNAFGKYIKESTELYLSDLGADTSGYTKKLHSVETGSNASYFVLSTDLTDKKGLSYDKRLLDLFLYVRKESSGTLTIEIKRNNETTWQSVGTIDLTGDEDILIQHLAPDLRAKTFLIKVSSSDHYRFLGLLFKFLITGER